MKPKTEAFAGGVKDAIIKFYERVQKGEGVPREEWDGIKKSIVDAGNALSERMRGIVTQTKEVKSQMDALKTKTNALRDQMKDLEADKRTAIEDLLRSYESELQALEVGQMAAWKLQDSHDATFGVVAARLEKEVTRNEPDKAEAMVRAVEILETKFPGLAEAFETTLKRVVASKTTIEETVELVITTTIPTISGVKKPGDVGASESVNASLKAMGIAHLVEAPKLIGDVWGKVKSVWSSVVSFIKGVVADLFDVSSQVDTVAAEAEAITNSLR